MKKISITISMLVFALLVPIGYQSVARGATTGPDLVITMTDQKGIVFAGEDITYTFSIDNIGSADASAVSMETTIPDFLTYISNTSTIEPEATTNGYSWTLEQLSAGDSKSFEVIFSTDQLLQTFTQDQVGFIKAAATISTTTQEPIKKNNSTTTETLVLPPPLDQTQLI